MPTRGPVLKLTLIAFTVNGAPERLQHSGGNIFLTLRVYACVRRLVPINVVTG